MTLYAKKASHINKKIVFKICGGKFYGSPDMSIWSENFNVELFQLGVKRFKVENILRRILIFLYYTKEVMLDSKNIVLGMLPKGSNKYHFYLE